ncbi:MAG: hypothetical protein AAF483_11290, partial [Planctomycetota bacterium]
TLTASSHTDDMSNVTTDAPGQPDDAILNSYFDAAETQCIPCFWASVCSSRQGRKPSVAKDRMNTSKKMLHYPPITIHRIG